MFQKIVVAYDGSPHSKRALDMAIDIAKKYGSRLYIIEVVDPAALIGLGVSPVPQTVLDQLYQKAKDDIEEARKRAAGLETEGQVLEGDPATSILEFVDKVKADLLVSGSRGLSTLKRLFLGSVSSRLVSEARIPVLVVK
ncbi:MAG: universal stress protein [Thermocladium sp.]|jgi:nucleotide-binding universal stress UspA family protein|nr:MAG: universal stress protein UspA [Thermocladium sp. ECH_B]